MKPCLDCQTPTEGSRCEDCRRPHRTEQVGSARARGYDSAWNRLSKRARRMSPLCEVCGSTEDLQTDHLPSAWERKAAGKPLRLADVRVLCRPCNVAAGSSRPENASQRREVGVSRPQSDQGTRAPSEAERLRSEPQGQTHTPWGYADTATTGRRSGEAS